MGGGFPCAAFGGRCELMEQLAPIGPVYQAGTLSGNPVAVPLASRRSTSREQPTRTPQLDATADATDRRAHGGVLRQRDPRDDQSRRSLFSVFFSGDRSATSRMPAAADHARYARFFHRMLDPGCTSRRPATSCGR